MKYFFHAWIDIYIYKYIYIYSKGGSDISLLIYKYTHICIYMIYSYTLCLYIPFFRKYHDILLLPATMMKPFNGQRGKGGVGTMLNRLGPLSWKINVWFYIYNSVGTGCSRWRIRATSTNRQSTHAAVWYCYNAINFQQNHHNRHLVARPWGRAMGCMLWF